MTREEKVLQLKQDFDEVYEAGKKAEYDAFWDNLQRNGTRTHYAYAFAYSGWNDTNYNPKYPITPTNGSGIGNIFVWNHKITDTKVPITAYGSCNAAFSNAANLQRMPKLIFNGTTNVNNMFLNCGELVELNCEGVIDINGLNLQWSTKLSKASIESIINCLDLTEGRSATTVTLSLTAVNKAFETSEGANDGAESYEFNSICASARVANWTISLV